MCASNNSAWHISATYPGVKADFRKYGRLGKDLSKGVQERIARTQYVYHH